MYNLTINDVIERFNRPVTLDEKGCWIWGGAISHRGYGKLGNAFAYAIVCGMVGLTCKVGFELCHSCNNKKCVNPNHIYIGTHEDNIRDAVAAMAGPRRITDEGYRMIEELDIQKVPRAEIARRMNVSRAIISNFLNGDLKYAKPSRSSE